MEIIIKGVEQVEEGNGWIGHPSLVDLEPEVESNLRERIFSILRMFGIDENKPEEIFLVLAASLISRKLNLEPTLNRKVKYTFSDELDLLYCPLGADGFFRVVDKKRSIDFSFFLNINSFFVFDDIYDESTGCLRSEFKKKVVNYRDVNKDFLSFKEKVNDFVKLFEFRESSLCYYLFCRKKYFGDDIFSELNIVGFSFGSLFFNNLKPGGELKVYIYLKVLYCCIGIYSAVPYPNSYYNVYFPSVLSVSIVFEYFVKSRIFEKLRNFRDFKWAYDRLVLYIEKRIEKAKDRRDEFFIYGYRGGFRKEFNEKYFRVLSCSENIRLNDQKIILALVLSRYLKESQAKVVAKALDSSFRSKKYDKSTKAKKARKKRLGNK